MQMDLYQRREILRRLQEELGLVDQYGFPLLTLITGDGNRISSEGNRVLEILESA